MNKRATGRVNRPSQKMMVSRFPVKMKPHLCAVLAHCSAFPRDSSGELAKATGKANIGGTDSFVEGGWWRMRVDNCSAYVVLDRGSAGSVTVQRQR